MQPLSLTISADWGVVVVNTTRATQLLIIKTVSQNKLCSVAGVPLSPGSQSSRLCFLHLCVYMHPSPDLQNSKEGEKRLVTATSSDHHVAVLLEDDIGAVIEVEH